MVLYHGALLVGEQDTLLLDLDGLGKDHYRASIFCRFHIQRDFASNCTAGNLFLKRCIAAQDVSSRSSGRTV